MAKDIQEPVFRVQGGSHLDCSIKLLWRENVPAAVDALMFMPGNHDIGGLVGTAEPRFPLAVLSPGELSRVVQFDADGMCVHSDKLTPGALPGMPGLLVKPDHLHDIAIRSDYNVGRSRSLGVLKPRYRGGEVSPGRVVHDEIELANALLAIG